MSRMVRKQVSVTVEQNHRLKARAVATGLSEGALIRNAIDRYLGQEPQQRPWRDIVDETVAKLSGVWAERDDLDELLRTNRRSWKRRRKRLGLT